MSDWQQLLSTALLGTSQRPITPPPGDSALHQSIAAISADNAEAQLLSAAVLQSLHRQASLQATAAPALSYQPCPVDPRPEFDARFEKAFEHLLAHPNGVMLAERFFKRLPKDGRRIPDRMLKAVTDFARQNTQLQLAIVPFLPRLAAWLTQFHQEPLWELEQLLNQEQTPEWTEQWLNSARANQLLYVDWLKQHDPAKALALIETHWKALKPALRLELLDLWLNDPPAEAEPFFERVLRDSATSLYEITATLLSRIPTSAWVQRASELSPQFVQLQTPPDQPAPSGLAAVAQRIQDAANHLIGREQQAEPQIVVTMPDLKALETVLKTSRLQALLKQKYLQGFSQEELLLSELLAATPLSVWEASGYSPDAIVSAGLRTEHHDSLLHGWAYAAMNQRNELWAKAILRAITFQRGHDLLRELIPEKKVRQEQLSQWQRKYNESLYLLLSPEDFEASMVAEIKRDKFNFRYHMHNVLSGYSKPWSATFTRQIVEYLIDISNNLEHSFSTLHYFEPLLLSYADYPTFMEMVPTLQMVAQGIDAKRLKAAKNPETITDPTVYQDLFAEFAERMALANDILKGVL
jgi:hypothetical protein